MAAYLLEWLDLLLRWLHVVVGIAWVGSSFYFIWLDNSLNIPPRDAEDSRVAGDLWAVHGGGFYHSQKYQVAPEELPQPLHWFKWEAYTTWISGFLLLALVYYLNADLYLIDPAVADIRPLTGIAVSLSGLVLGWLVYDGLCQSGLGNRAIGIAGLCLLTALAFGITRLFSGRGAYIQVGAMLGTIMAANVFLVIIPSQKQLVSALREGVAPDAALGRRAKQRSMHNNYLTLPVVLLMVSPHYPMAYAHRYNWLVLIALGLAGALTRHYLNLRHRGRNVPLVLLGAAGLLALSIALDGASRRVAHATVRLPGTAQSREYAGPPVTASVKTIIAERCLVCHSRSPSYSGIAAPPNGVMFDTDDGVRRWATRIYERAVATGTMPVANVTAMTAMERAAISAWFLGAPLE